MCLYTLKISLFLRLNDDLTSSSNDNALFPKKRMNTGGQIITLPVNQIIPLDWVGEVYVKDKVHCSKVKKLQQSNEDIRRYSCCYLKHTTPHMAPGEI
jgi:hypothetical protein